MNEANDEWTERVVNEIPSFEFKTTENFEKNNNNKSTVSVFRCVFV